MNLDFLRPLFTHRGPWVSVYLDATRASENGDHEVALRWRALREQLTRGGGQWRRSAGRQQPRRRVRAAVRSGSTSARRAGWSPRHTAGR